MPNASFNFKNQQLYCENVSCSEIAQAFATPCYVYSQQHITQQYQYLQQHLGSVHKIFYAVKANSNLAILNLLKNLGAGFDTVSLGEIKRVLQIGVPANKIVFSGVGKSYAELEFAIKQQIYGIHVESANELQAIVHISNTLQVCANIAIRVNPDIDANTHPYISTGLHGNKFGVSASQALDLYTIASKAKFIKIVGITCHIGSQIKEVAPYLAAAQILLKLKAKLLDIGVKLAYMDIGGGMAISYANDDLVFDVKRFGLELSKLMANHPELTLHLEPGRFIVGNAGVLLTSVHYIKDTAQKKFMIIDAAMNDLIRPCLYQSAHTVINTRQSTVSSNIVDIVGPICESSDFIAKDYPLAAIEGDVLAIKGCGAYAASMASNYNSRPRAPEILVNDNTYTLIRRRETVEELFEVEIF
jgi:diaminopimelate decarboxylase